MPPKPTNLVEYLATLTETQRETVQRMLQAIHAAAPKADAVFSYNMPGFKLNGEPLAWAAAWKHHYSMYPLTQTMTDACNADVADYELAKGTIRFPADEPVPFALITKLVKFRAAEIRAKPRKT